MDWRKTTDYRKWRIAVIRRDGVCQLCGSKSHRHAHHINHAAYFESQRFDINNGICLCGDCHSQYHNNYHNSTREKCTRYDFNNFLSLVKYIKELVWKK